MVFTWAWFIGMSLIGTLVEPFLVQILYLNFLTLFLVMAFMGILFQKPEMLGEHDRYWLHFGYTKREFSGYNWGVFVGLIVALLIGSNTVFLAVELSMGGTPPAIPYLLVTGIVLTCGFALYLSSRFSDTISLSRAKSLAGPGEGVIDSAVARYIVPTVHDTSALSNMEIDAESTAVVLAYTNSAVYFSPNFFHTKRPVVRIPLGSIVSIEAKGLNPTRTISDSRGKTEVDGQLKFIDSIVPLEKIRCTITTKETRYGFIFKRNPRTLGFLKRLGAKDV